MFGSLGGAEILLVLVLALLLFGPRKLPQIGRTIGGALSEFRKATNEFKSNLEREVDLTEVRAAHREVTDGLRGIGDVTKIEPVADTDKPSATATDAPDTRES
jgi:TatA/E family protein of Tat protein translocase